MKAMMELNSCLIIYFVRKLCNSLHVIVLKNSIVSGQLTIHQVEWQITLCSRDY